MFQPLLICFICFITSLIITPVVRRIALKVNATDAPNHRKVHEKIMPRLGGLAIFISFVIGVVLLYPHKHLIRPYDDYIAPIILGACIIVVIGVIDDLIELSAKVKFVGQIVAALVVVLGGVRLNYITLPISQEVIEFGMLSIPLTIIWIVSITNAINLIDGLDGLAGGVSSIALITMGAISFTTPANDIFVFSMAAILVGSTLGFLKYNFYPAKIFMGDTGALFLGFMIGVLSLLGFKNVTITALVIPVIILGVPISDTLFAIIRRVVNKQPISVPDKSHLHHCLLNLGYSHRQTVIIIYAMAAIFGLAAYVTSMATIIGAMLICILLTLAMEFFAKKIGLFGKNYRPIFRIIFEKIITNSSK